MKLARITESSTILESVPRELKRLAGDYWAIRNKVIADVGRADEPYICEIISERIKDYLEDKGHRVTLVQDKDPIDRVYHIYLEVDDQYIVDGSDYQFDYFKPISKYLPSRIAKILNKNGSTTIGSVIALIDFTEGHDLVWFDRLDSNPIDQDESHWSPNTNRNKHKQALQELRPADLQIIKGRLLPIMLKIRPSSEYKYIPMTA